MIKWNIIELNQNSKLINKTKTFLFKMIKEEYNFDYIPEYHYDIKDLEKIYISNEKNNFFIAVDKRTNKIIGTLAIRQYDKNFTEFKKRYSKNNTTSIWRVFVDKKYRRKGIATALVKKAEEFAEKQKFNEIYLHTHKNINGALNFWLSQDYKITLDTNNKLATVHMEKTIESNVFKEIKLQKLAINAK